MFGITEAVNTTVININIILFDWKMPNQAYSWLESDFNVICSDKCRQTGCWWDDNKKCNILTTDPGRCSCRDHFNLYSTPFHLHYRHFTPTRRARMIKQFYFFQRMFQSFYCMSLLHWTFLEYSWQLYLSDWNVVRWQTVLKNPSVIWWAMGGYCLVIPVTSSPLVGDKTTRTLWQCVGASGQRWAGQGWAGPNITLVAANQSSALHCSSHYWSVSL